VYNPTIGVKKINFQFWLQLMYYLLRLHLIDTSFLTVHTLLINNLTSYQKLASCTLSRRQHLHILGSNIASSAPRALMFLISGVGLKRLA
jgi:hypothetical protein